MAERLDREAWVRAALDAFEEGGPAAVAIVPLAERLGVTRGSFYWHFDSRDELLTAALDLWEHEHSDAVMDAVAQLEDPHDRLQALAEAATSKPPSIFVQLLRSSDDPLVRATLERSAAKRMAVLQDTYRAAGLPPAAARRRAIAAYAHYVGLAYLLHDDPQLLSSPRERAAYARDLTDRLRP